MIVPKVLAIVTIILGIYVILWQIFTYQPKGEDYHLGCYLVNGTVSQSSEIESKIKEIELVSSSKRDKELE